MDAKQREAKVGDLREWSITSLVKVANLRNWLLIFATGRFAMSSSETLKEELLIGGKDLGAAPPAAGDYGGLGTKPPAAGRFFVIFWKKKLF